MGQVQIRIDRRSAVPLYLQISAAIRELIVGGRLPEGFRLPAERELARALAVTRTTVLAAYRALKAEALVDAHVGRGTSVLPRGRALEAVAQTVEERTAPLAWDQLARESATSAGDPLLRDLLELGERRDVINFSVGLPAADLLPLAALRRVQGRLVDELGPSLLLHSPTEGVTAFREALAELVAGRGIASTPSEVLITSGSQQALDLVTRTFLAPGDAVVVEEPTYFGALQVFRTARLRLLGVPADEDGLRTDLLEALLARQRPRLIYTLPTFGNPTGAVLSLARRRHLLELARRHGVPIVEDDPYSELRYEGSALPSLRALDGGGQVIYLSSFSKVLFPGLRIGFLIAPLAALGRLVLTKQAVDLHSSTPGQWILERFIRSGLYRKHVARARAEYAARRSALDETLRDSAGDVLSWRRPSGGFYLWARLRRPLPQAALLARATERRVAYLPGRPCFVNDPGATYLRLNFTYPTRDEIRDGVRRLGDALKKELARARKSEERPAAAHATAPIV